MVVISVVPQLWRLFSIWRHTRRCHSNQRKVIVVFLLVAVLYGLVGRNADWFVTDPQRSNIVIVGGQQWRRIGKTFIPFNLDTVIISFKLATSAESGHGAGPNDTESVLFFAQSLAGVFHPVKQQYVAVTVKSTANVSTAVVRVKAASQNVVSRQDVTLHSGDADLWNVLVVCPICKDICGVVHSSQEMVSTWQRRNIVASLLESRSTSAAGSGGHFTADSGLYLGGVFDSGNTAPFEDMKNVVPFRGKIVSRMYANGEALDIVDHTDSKGPVVEYVRSVMTKTLLPVLGQPITADLTNKKTDLTDPLVAHFPLVSAVSDNHAEECEDMLASLAQHMPQRGILLYDIGLNPNNRARLKRFCNVALRRFRADLFRDLQGDIFSYRWKPLVVYSSFVEFGAVAWADASIRFKKSFDELPLFNEGYGFVGFRQHGASPIGAFTHNGTLATLGVDRSEVAKAEITITGIHVWLPYHTLPPLLADYWLACALHKECLAPTGALLYTCRLEERLKGHYIGCHRFDQSALSVILTKVFHSQKGLAFLTNESIDMNMTLSIKRYPTKLFKRCYRTT